ncbi:MAG: hypothetical protein M9894_14870 [Planctomycetes bacterium]|nr:hypothetical protein [Planctomycetota bacterium]
MDDRLQDLRRRVAQGEPGARVALLAERVRTGDITRERLELAAYVGDDDARQLCAGMVLDSSAALTDWYAGMLRFGPEAAVRSGLALLALAREPAGEGTSAALALLERWALCPCADHAESARVSVWTGPRDPDDDGDTRLVCVLMLAEDAGRRPSARYVTLEWARNRQGATDDDVRAAIRNEVAPWALGERDPVRERVDAAGGFD